MDIPHLIKMANQIGTFFESMPDRAQAIEDIASHIHRFWDPRMRRAIFACIDANQAGALAPIVLEALNSHRAQLA